jgi:hypothetical protein
MVRRKALEETPPDHPGSLVWSFLMDFAKKRLALAPEVNTIAYAWG